MALIPQLSALAQVIVIDVSLAADNAVVIGAAAAGLPKDQRHRAVALGLGGAVAARIVLAFFAVKLLKIAGLTFAGGLLLLWVAWKMFRQIRQQKHDTAPSIKARKQLSDAVWQILIADLAMSVDNVLGVAGAARHHYAALMVGLVLSVALVGAAATASAKLFHRYPWLIWAGIATVLYVAITMMADGAGDIRKFMTGTGSF